MMPDVLLEHQLCIQNDGYLPCGIYKILEGMIDKRTFLGFLGCFGGLMIHLIVGSPYQWGNINVYITSYFKKTEPDLTLEGNAVVFPVMMFSTGIMIESGVLLAQKFGPIKVLFITELLQAATIFASSYIPNFTGFAIVYGCIFGLLVGTVFLIPLIELNKYFPGRRMEVNGFILIGTGLGSLIFAQFSSLYINPQRLPSNAGYYDGKVGFVADNVPSCIRWLACMYLIIGITACFLILPVLLDNKKKEEEEKERQKDKALHNEHTVVVPGKIENDHHSDHHNDHHELTSLQPKDAQGENHDHHEEPVKAEVRVECPSVGIALKSRLFWAIGAVAFFCSCGDLLVNGNFKTYVKKVITDDEFLTLCGSIGGIGNGCSRFLWNLLFLKIGYRNFIRVLVTMNMILFLVIRWTPPIRELYGLMIFISNACLGGVFVSTPTYSMIAFGPRTGSRLYTYFFLIISTSNFLQYIYVVFLTKVIGFDNVFWIIFACLGCLIPLVIFYNFEQTWPSVAPQDPSQNHLQLKADENVHHGQTSMVMAKPMEIQKQEKAKVARLGAKLPPV